MDNKSTSNWDNYYENTKNYPPAPLLVKALEYVETIGKAIDIGGGGTLKDTLFLLSKGFDTTVVDKEDVIAVSVEKVGSDKLHFFVSSFSDFDFPVNEYDLAAAIYSLPFTPPKDFERVFEKVKSSLVQNGVFCGQFFGDRDGWKDNSNLTFVTKEKAMSMLDGMEVLHFEEKEFDGKTADGSAKHWHVFDIIARKL